MFKTLESIIGIDYKARKNNNLLRRSEDQEGSKTRV